MSLADPAFWPSLAIFGDFVGGLAAVTVALWLVPRRARFGPAGDALCAALALSALWCLAAMVGGGRGPVAEAALGLRNLAYLAAVYRLFASDGRHTSFAPVRPVALVLVFAVLLQLTIAVVERQINPAWVIGGPISHLYLVVAMLVAVGSLVLVHNLYVGATGAARGALRLPALALAMVWAFELNLYTVAYLGGRWPVPLAALRGLVEASFAVVLMIGGSRNHAQLRLRPSRAVAFHSMSLLVIAAYFVAMAAVSDWLAYAGGDFARWLQFSFLIGGSAAALLVLPSRRARGWLRVTLTKHLFQHRYDYRAEWLRFARTIAHDGEDAAPLQVRAVQAVADIADSPAGLLLIPGDEGELVLAARWQWPGIEVPAIAGDLGLIRYLEHTGYVVDVAGLRADSDQRGAGAVVPQWLRADPHAWALVPLLHYERLVGAVALARPPHARTLDWEDFDLLKVVGQQLATYLAEHSGQQALTEASRFDEFNRRIAFVMHDIKNLASQFSLLARNAERHADNPEFRADMLKTLRNSADKLNALIARLSRYGGGAVEKIEAVDIGIIARQVASQFVGRHQVTVIERSPCEVAGHGESLEQMLAHLVQNAVDASDAGAPVFISVVDDGVYASIEVVDSGHGMSPEFVRNRLFKPFDSSKPGGFGIGAYEARELARAMGGRLEVESREGLGTRFVIRLPLAEAGKLIRQLDSSATHTDRKSA
ncbi:MAG: PEP-CTERM system histidine kinase PrsK [Proteobacteria bacterium]|nr:PEP-CTERM system histidine kinase PrsK [Pseudomonadota bacterium]